jgi:hypothetical protein
MAALFNVEILMQKHLKIHRFDVCESMMPRFASF